MDNGKHVLALMDRVHEMGILLSETCTAGPELRRWMEMRPRIRETVLAIRADAASELGIQVETKPEPSWNQVPDPPPRG